MLNRDIRWWRWMGAKKRVSVASISVASISVASISAASISAQSVQSVASASNI